MGLEERKGKTYYYKKKRLGHRVVSEYVGGGTLAILSERLAVEQAAAAAKHKLVKEKREEIIKIETNIDCLLNWVETLSSSELVLAGYHQHKGEWRKRQNGRFSTKERRRNSSTNRPK